APKLPPALEQMTISLMGLNDAYLYHVGKSASRRDQLHEMSQKALDKKSQINPDASGGNFNFIAPKDLGVAYNIKPQTDAGIMGQGQKVGIIIDSDVADSDVAKYRTTFNLPSANLKRLIPPGSSNPGTKFAVEAELDVESVSSIAPMAEIDLVLITQLNSAAIMNAEQFVVNTAKLPIVNESFSACESAVFDPAEQTLYLQAMTQGIAFFTGAGDDGAECAGASGKAEVNCPACYAGVTSVGGTQINGQFAANGDLTGINMESVWNVPPGVRVDCKGNPLSGGSGSSGG